MSDNKMYVTAFINFVLLLLATPLEMRSQNLVILVRQRLNEDIVSYMLPKSFFLSSMWIDLRFLSVLYHKVLVVIGCWLNFLMNFLEIVMGIVISRSRGHVVLLLFLNFFISWFERMVRVSGLVLFDLFHHLVIGYF